MPNRSHRLRICSVAGGLLAAAVLFSACGVKSSSSSASHALHSSGTSSKDTAGPSGTPSPYRPGPLLPAAPKVARQFTVAFLGHNARNGKDASYTATGQRAARYASGGLAKTLSQQRPGQRTQWDAWRDEEAVVAARVTRSKSLTVLRRRPIVPPLLGSATSSRSSPNAGLSAAPRGSSR